MMMLIFSIIVMCSNLYLMCLVLQVLKKLLSVVASKYNLCDAYAIWKTILRNLNYIQCLNIAPMEYNPNGKGTMIPVKYNPIVSSPNGKSTVL